MHDMTRHYLTCALWAETDNNGNPLDEKYTIADFSAEALERADRECTAFRSSYSDVVGDRLQEAGHDFWLTRNHHGAGFWDGDWQTDIGNILTAISHSFGEVHIQDGNDNKLYFV